MLQRRKSPAEAIEFRPSSPVRAETVLSKKEQSMSITTDSAANAGAKALRARLQFMENVAADLRRETDSLKGAIVKLQRDRSEAEACAKFWRDAADASCAMEARYKSTVLGLSHALADLKLAEADLDADRASPFADDLARS